MSFSKCLACDKNFQQITKDDLHYETCSNECRAIVQFIIGKEIQENLQSQLRKTEMFFNSRYKNASANPPVFTLSNNIMNPEYSKPFIFWASPLI